MKLQYEEQVRAINKSLWERGKISRRLTITLKLYVGIGLFIAIIGSGYLMFTELDIDLSPAGQFAVTAIVVGLTIALLAALLLLARHELVQLRMDTFNEYLLIGRFVQAWSAFEDAARSLVQIDSDENYSLRRLLESLRTQKILEPVDLIRIEEILQLRNAVIHSGMKIPKNEIENAYQVLLNYADDLSSTSRTSAAKRKV